MDILRLASYLLFFAVICFLYLPYIYVSLLLYVSDPPITPPPQRERFSYTRYQLELLTAIFVHVRYPNSIQKQLIAKRVGITRDQVKVRTYLKLFPFVKRNTELIVYPYMSFHFVRYT